MSIDPATLPGAHPKTGFLVDVFWEDRNTIFRGLVATRQSRNKSNFLIHYDDGDSITHDMNDKYWRYVDGAGKWFEPGDIAELVRDQADHTFQDKDIFADGSCSLRSHSKTPPEGEEENSSCENEDNCQNHGGQDDGQDILGTRKHASTMVTDALDNGWRPIINNGEGKVTIAEDAVSGDNAHRTQRLEIETHLNDDASHMNESRIAFEESPIPYKKRKWNTAWPVSMM